MTDTTQDLTVLEPAEIDALWAEALVPAARIEARIAGLRKQARRYRKFGGYDRQADEIDDQAHELENSDEYLVALDADVPFRDEWNRRDGWTRYFLVLGGHLHENHCHTLTPGRTLVGMLPEASGLSRSEVVERYDYTACTHCFPDAPVAPKLSAAEAGLCEHSGQFVESVEGASVRDEWYRYAVAPDAHCPCGYSGAITKSGKFRKHKAGG